MPTGSKKVPSHKKKVVEQTLPYWQRITGPLKKRHALFMERRLHRSFRLTRRRDYVRPLELPGYVIFTHEVTATLWRHKRTFLLLALVYVVLYGVLVGVQSQSTYSSISETLKDTGSQFFSGDWGALQQVGGTVLTIASVGVSGELTESQQIFAVLVFLAVWLSTVWLLRNILAGHTVRLRDGLYNSGAPIFSMIIVALIAALQLLPIAIAMIGYSAASASGLLAGGASSMLFWLAAGTLALLSLYWVTSSLFAMIIVTLPGMYPITALRSASELLLGRRVKILLRWLWMSLTLVVAWVVLLIPFVLLDLGIKSLWSITEWLPIVPIALLVLAALTTIWGSAYVYLLYRKVVDYVPES